MQRRRLLGSLPLMGQPRVDVEARGEVKTETSYSFAFGGEGAIQLTVPSMTHPFPSSRKFLHHLSIGACLEQLNGKCDRTITASQRCRGDEHFQYPPGRA
jgi:hypothetical protein